MAATLAMTLGVTLYSHSNSNHLTSKCPFAFIYGDKVIEHSINEVEKHLERINQFVETHNVELKEGQ